MRRFPRSNGQSNWKPLEMPARPVTTLREAVAAGVVRLARTGRDTDPSPIHGRDNPAHPR
jgi:hypothetical protein